jgi:hypothetical protein
MTILRQTLAATLAAALCAPASAQTYQGRLNAAKVSAVPQVTLGALGARLVIGTPGLASGLGATLTPTLSAPSLSAPLISPALAAAPVLPQTLVPITAPAPQAAASMKVSAVAEAVAPAIQALQAPGLKGEGAAAAAESVMSPVIGKSVQGSPSAAAAPEQTSPSAPKAASVRLRGAPVIQGLSYAAEVSAEHQALLAESLTRRKAGWTRGLAAMGLKLDGPVKPQVTVKSAREIAKGAKVEYTLEWNQGETRVGAFKAIVARKDAQPELRRGVAPEPAKEKQIRVRFKKDAPAADIEAFLESLGLRLLSKGWGDGYYRVSVTGQDQADAKARGLSRSGLVLYATPETFAVPQARQVQLVFKKDAGEDRIASALAAHGLRVLSLDYYGNYTVGAEDLDAAAAARSLQAGAGVHYARPVVFDPPASSQLIVSLRDGVGDIAPLLRSYGLMVVKVLNNGAYKVARVSDATPAKDILEDVSKEPVVKAAIILGGVTDEQIQSAARGVASYKGRPWSSTEYNMNYGMTYWSLEERGATPEQLKLFEKLCDEAPVRGGGFNPWSGD